MVGRTMWVPHAGCRVWAPVGHRGAGKRVFQWISVRKAFAQAAV